MTKYATVIDREGYNPIYDENDTFRWWAIDDIWMGVTAVRPDGKPRYVAKVNDYVIRPTTFETWRVESVDQETLIPKLTPISPYGSSGEMSQQDILFGVGPGTQAQLLRVYVNRTTYPYKLTVDTHCFVGGTANAYAVIYRGGDPTMGGEPVSRMYDNSGNFMGSEVPLELVALDSHQNHSIKIVQECWTTTDLPDGEALTVIFYSSDNIPQSKSMLLAENTTYIRGLDIQRKFVTNISLESPWLSKADPNVLQYPLNIPVNALDLVGVVQYSDGTRLKLPVDGTKFSMLGLDNYISSIPGEKFDTVLSYALDEGEISYAGQGMYVNRTVTAPYSVITQPIEPGYTVKLFPYPLWNVSTGTYRLRYWLYNLARNTVRDVTDLVMYSADRPAFDPFAFGVRQRLQVNLNLRKVSNAYNPLIHTQMFDLTLLGRPVDVDTPWIINTQLSQGMPGYGLKTYATRMDTNRFFVNGGYDKLDDWLRAYYYNSEPLVDRRSEVLPPTPTHFWVSLDYGETWDQYFIEDSWNALLYSKKEVKLYDTVMIRFTRPGTNGPIELSIGAMAIRQ